MGIGNLECIHRPAQTCQVSGKIDQLALENACYLVHSISHQEPAVKDRNSGLGFGQGFAVHMDNPDHGQVSLSDF